MDCFRNGYRPFGKLGASNRRLAVRDGVAPRDSVDRLGTFVRFIRIIRLLRRRRECRGVCRIADDGNNGRRPAVERIGIVLVFRLGRGRAVVNWGRTVLDRSGCNRLTLDNPRNRVAALRSLELRRVGRRASDGGDGGRPASELVGVFRCRFLRRRIAAVSRRRAVFDRAGGDRHALDDPRNRVAALRRLELRRVRRRARHRRNRRRPARELVAVFSCRFLRRRLADELGRLTILDRAGGDRRALDDPRHRVAALCLRELCRVGSVVCHRRDSRRPAVERVRIFSGLGLRRRLAAVCRCRAVFNRTGGDSRALDNPRNRVAALRSLELRRVRRFARHRRNRRRPAAERVAVFRRRFLRRRIAAVCRCRAVFNRTGGDSRALDNPRNRVAALRSLELRRVRRFARHRRDCW